MATKTTTTQQKYESVYLALIILLSLLFYALFIYRTAFSINGQRYFTLVDDAMISMRYAKNFANGAGLVWNVGEPPIQGFTNLGWTLYMGLLHKLPVPEATISLFVMLTSSFLLAGNTILAYKLCKAIAPQTEKAPLIAATITAFYYPLVYWSLRGMEVALSSCLLYSCVLLAVDAQRSISRRKAVLLGVIMLLGVLVRLDAALQLAIIVGYILLEHLKQRSQMPMVLSALSGFGAGIIGLLLFQYHYFGSIYPNTYYLKVSGVSLYERVELGVQVLVQYAARDSLTLLAVILLGLLFYRHLRTRTTWLLLALFFIQCAYSIYVGGDYAERLNQRWLDAPNRFVTQGMPAIIVLFSIIFDDIWRDLASSAKIHLRWPAMQAICIGLTMLLIMSGTPWFSWVLHNAPMLGTDIRRARRGVHLQKYTEQEVTIAVHAAGQIPYYANRRTIDLLGKSDAVIARGEPSGSFRPGHNKWDYTYSIATLKPDIVADRWNQIEAFMETQLDYYELPNGLYVRYDRDFPNIDQLAQEHR